jgi:hypothetical protein
MPRSFIGLCVIVVGLTTAVAAQSASQKIAGHLVDGVCADNHHNEPGYGANHEKSCSLMEGCMKTGYAVITEDRRVFKFDKSGNERALALIKATDRNKDWKVVVSGKVEGQTIAVDGITLQ